MATVDTILLAVELVSLQGSDGTVIAFVFLIIFSGITLQKLWKQYQETIQDKIVLDSYVKQFIWDTLQLRDDILVKKEEASTGTEKQFSDFNRRLTLVEAEAEPKLLVFASESTRKIALGVNLLDVRSLQVFTFC